MLMIEIKKLEAPRLDLIVCHLLQPDAVGGLSAKNWATDVP